MEYGKLESRLGKVSKLFVSGKAGYNIRKANWEHQNRVLLRTELGSLNPGTVERLFRKEKRASLGKMTIRQHAEWGRRKETRKVVL